MSAQFDDEYKFPDEIENETTDIEIEIEDDTPEEYRGRQPMPKHIVEDLDKDELEEYDEGVKQKLKQLKKVWHDERREKEQALREQQESIALSKRLYEENQKLRAAYTTGEKEYISTSQQAAQMEVDAAKHLYREAYESGNTDGIIDAQEKLQFANLKMIRANNLKQTTLQETYFPVQREREEYQQPAPKLNPKDVAWQERNQWFGEDEEMTSAALGLHTKLVNSGMVAGSDEYYSTLDKTMRKRFNEYFGEPEPKAKPSTVVAPGARSTASNKIRLNQSQVQLAKKLGISPEIYAKEVLKLENK